MKYTKHLSQCHFWPPKISHHFSKMYIYVGTDCAMLVVVCASVRDYKNNPYVTVTMTNMMMMMMMMMTTTIVVLI